MNATSTSTGQMFRPQLLERRARLQAAADSVSPAYFNDLIAEIDAALGRIDSGSYGLCETCHDTIEADRLERNPLVRFCLDHLSQAELLAHQQDLELATQIQSKLLPPRDIVLEKWDTQYRYEPVGAVGGDYCELVVLHRAVASLCRRHGRDRDHHGGGAVAVRSRPNATRKRDPQSRRQCSQRNAERRQAHSRDSQREAG